MKITRHTARDMRQALKAVRDKLGPDAVILASRRTPNGVEVTAAMDFDAENLPPAAPLDVPGPGLEISSALSAALQPVTMTSARRAAAAPPAAEDLMFEPPPQALAALPLTTRETAVTLGASPAAAPVMDTTDVQTSEAMSRELKTLRRMLETQLAQLAWNDLARRAPIHSEMLRELTEIGVVPEIASDVVSQIPAGTELTQARRLAIALIAQRVLVTGDRWLESGGRVALIGATGVGKTLTLAKLAVRWVLRHGARDLALVAGDTMRIGAHDQVNALGRLLGAAVYPLEDFAALPELMMRISRHRMVLIDTPGSSQRDALLTERLNCLAAAGPELQSALVLATSTQAGAVAEAVQRFAPAKPTCCVLTKVDEAASLGGMLSILVRAGLPISYVSEGQRVPEDLRPARALELVSSAVQLARASGAVADEDLLKRRFGEVAHALA